MARVWDEALLDAIRRDVPAPTVHARNLFHVSAAMWDAWAAYDPVADGYFVGEKHEADDVRAAREAAISYAAYRILLHRYSLAAGLEETFAELADTMRVALLPHRLRDRRATRPPRSGTGSPPRSSRTGVTDGSLEERRYIEPDYKPVNDPLVVASGAPSMRDPNRWQPLALDPDRRSERRAAPRQVQGFVGPHWGHVRAFALPRRPRATDRSRPAAALRGGAATSRRRSPSCGTAASSIRRTAPRRHRPAARGGDNPLGTNDGDGYDATR